MRDSSLRSRFKNKLELLSICGFAVLTPALSCAQDGTSGELREIDRQIDAIVLKFDDRLENLASRPEEIASKAATVGVESLKSDLQRCEARLGELAGILASRQSDIQASAALPSADKKELIAVIRTQLASLERTSAKTRAISDKISELPSMEKIWNEQYSSFSAVKGTEEAAAKVSASINEFRKTLPGHEQAQQTAGNRTPASPTSSQNSPRAVPPDAKPQVDRSNQRYPETVQARLTPDDVAKLNAAQIRYAINEMYARYGLVFRDKQIQRNFERTKWYSPQTSLTPAQIEERFTPVERANLELLGQARERLTAKQPQSTPTAPQRKFSNPIAYFSACQEHVDAYWRSPAITFAPGHSAIAVVRVAISPDGRIASAQWVQSSGYRIWDQAVMECLQNLPAFPAPPASMGKRVDVQIVFPETT
jgi:TonB family protein